MEEKRNYKLKSIISNNYFILKIVWDVSKTRFILKFFVTIINAILPMLNIIITRNIIAMIESDIQKSTDNFQPILILIILLMCLQIIPRIFAVWNSALIEPILASKINRHVNELFIEKVSKFDYENFENSEFFDKYTRALGQVDSITHNVFNSFFNLLSSIVGIISLIALIVTMDWIIILFALFGVAANFIQSLITSKLNYNTLIKLTPHSRKQNYIKRLMYIPDYAKDIKCNGIMETGKRYYTDALSNIINILKKYGFKIALINTLITALSSISSAIMMIMLFVRVWLGIYMIADFTALTSSVTQLENVLNLFLTTITGLYSNSMYIDDFKYILFNKEDDGESDKTNIKFDIEKPCKIEVKNLYFKYPNSLNYALKNISFTILPGEKVSIVGLNGSGKTTLIKLILRLYEPERGDIFINDINVKEYNKEDIQKNVGVVFQDHYVYAYTVKENIAFEEKLRESTLDILGELGISQKLNTLFDHYDTYLSKEFYDNGVNLSGGEIQKICIARALNKISGLCIFDEPSSALDMISENKMNKVMLNSSNKTVVIISHRLSTVVNADKILVLQNGELVESGCHKELMENNGIYAQIFNQQTEQYLTKNSRYYDT